eukprot:scaffold3607_cov148-Ochromonas_danica.AAC.2
MSSSLVIDVLFANFKDHNDSTCSEMIMKEIIDSGHVLHIYHNILVDLKSVQSWSDQNEITHLNLAAALRHPPGSHRWTSSGAVVVVWCRGVSGERDTPCLLTRSEEGSLHCQV